MSSILKALKKLEHEKSGRCPDLLNINSDILKTTSSSRNFSPFTLVLLFLLVFGGGAAVAFFFMEKTEKLQLTNKSQPASTVQIFQPPVSTQDITPEKLPAEITVVPARKETSGKLPHKELKKTASANKGADSIIENSARATVPGIAKKPEETIESVKKEMPDVATVQTLRVTGIAFQNSAAGSMAIVNGKPVSNGSTIGGTTVEEVRKDRVLFQRDGEKFEIQLGQSNR
jgi:hypothetical protein